MSHSHRKQDYASTMRTLRSLERDQREIHDALRTRLYVLADANTGSYVRMPLPVTVQGKLQRLDSVNAWVITNMLTALAFCRNRPRQNVPPSMDLGLEMYVHDLSLGTGWTNPNAVRALYEGWAAWCNGAAAQPGMLAWQKQFRRNERQARKARKAARKAAQAPEVQSCAM